MTPEQLIDLGRAASAASQFLAVVASMVDRFDAGAPAGLSIRVDADNVQAVSVSRGDIGAMLNAALAAAQSANTAADAAFKAAAAEIAG